VVTEGQQYMNQRQKKSFLLCSPCSPWFFRVATFHAAPDFECSASKRYGYLSIQRGHDTIEPFAQDIPLGGQ
jgi:hypothetical protein